MKARSVLFTSIMVMLMFSLQACSEGDKVPETEAQASSQVTETAPQAEPASEVNTATAAEADKEAEKSSADDYKTTRMVEDQYVFVVEAIKGAIGDRGIKINGVNYIGKMLKRTADVVGATEDIYVHGQAYNFCSSTLSRATMEADPHNIAFCPYIITIYELKSEPGNIYVTYRKPLLVGNEASVKSLKAIGDLLDGIVEDAIGK